MAKRKRLTPARMLDEADMPGETPPLTRGPLGARPPIAEVAQDAAAMAALSDVVEELTDARESGRLIQKLPLACIEADYLARDRMSDTPTVETLQDMEALIESLRSRGQQTAIEVTELGDGRYGLISGWRRIQALQRLYALGEGPDHVLAVVRRPEEASDAYRAMVEENEIRSDLSFYERGRIVLKAVERGIYPDDTAALRGLFGSVPRARRSKIKSFAELARLVEGVLVYPSALSEKAGLALLKHLRADPAALDRLRRHIARTPPATAGAEAALIQKVMAGERRDTTEELSAREQVIPGLFMSTPARGKILLDGPLLHDAKTLEALRELLKIHLLDTASKPD